MPFYTRISLPFFELKSKIERSVFALILYKILTCVSGHRADMTKIIIKVVVKVYDNIRIIHIPETEVTVLQLYVQTGAQRGQIMKIFISCSLKNKKK